MKNEETVEEVASVSECTGLMPALPVAPAQARQLAGLMAIHCPPGANAPDPARP